MYLPTALPPEPQTSTKQAQQSRQNWKINLEGSKQRKYKCNEQGTARPRGTMRDIRFYNERQQTPMYRNNNSSRWDVNDVYRRNNNNYRGNRTYYAPNYQNRFSPRYTPNQPLNRGKIPQKSSVQEKPHLLDEDSEEYVNNKIQQTSAIIMRQLLNPEEDIIQAKNNNSKLPEYPKEQAKVTEKPSTPIKNNKRRRNDSSNTLVSTENKPDKSTTYTAEQISNKIMAHLINLNDGRKKNLIIRGTSSVYDDAITNILKQKRLEISRALRNVRLKSADVTDSSELINSIIPDMGIKIEDLPQEILEELQNTFENLEEIEDYESINSDDNEIFIRESDVCFNVGSPDNNSMQSNSSEAPIKNELDDLANQPDKDFNEMEASTNQIDTELNEMDVSTNQIDKDLNEMDASTNHIETDFNEIDHSEIKIEEHHIEDDSVTIRESDVCLDMPSSQHSDLIQIKSEIDLPSNKVDSDITNTLSDDTKELDTNKEMAVPDKSDSMTIEEFIKMNFKFLPKNYSQALKQMSTIDEYIKKLMDYRQRCFIALDKRIKRKKRKRREEKSTDLTVKRSTDEAVVEETLSNVKTPSSMKETTSNNDNNLETNKDEGATNFTDIKEKVLVLKVCDLSLLVATESGKIYFYDLNLLDSNFWSCEYLLHVTTLPITYLAYKVGEDKKPYLFVGSAESSLKIYNFYSKCLLKNIELDDSVQCMDENWGSVFLGCLRGTIMRYSIEKQQIEYKDQFFTERILTIKATVEGARRVLLIGTRNSPIMIRDAMNGLLLRKIDTNDSTVYSMVIHKNYIICGTQSFDILIFNFHNGQLEHRFDATMSKGVPCMKLVGKCLFAGCRNGNIYVFNLETNVLLDTLRGPGDVIVSMEILNNQVIIGTLSLKMVSVPISSKVLSELN
ncbi:unnamed protein product [Phyllotreta striolata]|uniref:Uncharacterized protein n=1 Tax=Phyllotreta striolata TaxID=444603 RepID=A0A9N9TIF4_PHYSR|nr:unnamed protein product [Phyllotreta striolata]